MAGSKSSPKDGVQAADQALSLLRKGLPKGCRSLDPALVGCQFGSWTILSADLGFNTQVTVHCRCACGKEAWVQKGGLVNGKSRQCKSCGMLDHYRNRTTPKPSRPRLSKVDWLGRQFGSWTVISEEVGRQQRQGLGGDALMIHCRCQCGEESWVQKGRLLDGGSRQCPTCARLNYYAEHKKEQNPRWKHSLPPEWVGRQFGSWTVISTEVQRKRRLIMVHCRCRCGKEKWVHKTSLVQGYTSACKPCGNIKYHHPAAQTLSKRYSGIVGRCTRPSHKAWHNYGGRGIECRFKSCEEFVRYMLENLPHPDYEGWQIDRINNDGHYEPGNLRLARRKDNLLNRDLDRNREFLTVP